jgi:hypothetical protein
MAIEKKKSLLVALGHLFYDTLLTIPLLVDVMDFWGWHLGRYSLRERLSSAVSASSLPDPLSPYPFLHSSFLSKHHITPSTLAHWSHLPLIFSS